jgi:SAM-dependent methyltransferase
MGLSAPVQRLGDSLRTQGPWRTARTIGKRLQREFFPAPVPTHPFDLEHEVDTSGLLFAEHLASGHENDDYINAYWGTPPSGFRGVMESWRRVIADGTHATKEYSFLDIGCGKGRALMLASELPFRRIVGVELNPALTNIAESNLTKWKALSHACGEIEVLNVDALLAPIPEGPVTVYIYNSFNLYVMLPFLERLQRLAQERLTSIELIYVQPQQARLLEGLPGVALLAADSIPLSPEDQAACAFGTSQLDFRIYRMQSRQEI